MDATIKDEEEFVLGAGTAEDTEKVLSRIVRRYNAAYTRSRREISYVFSAVEALF